MPTRRKKQGARHRYMMKYKARMNALSPSEMSAKALAENRAIAEALALAKAQEEEE